MARCDCAGGRCTCGVLAGDGIEVTGSGEASNPYIINVLRQPITGQLVVQDTESLDLTLTGEGSVNEPYILTGDVIPGLPATINGLIAAGENVTLTGSGTSADPYIVAADDPDTITGLIAAGDNITLTGTGTTADPYVIAGQAGNAVITGLIEAGANVTLTGSGTSADPYVIAVSTDITPNAITGLIQAGTNVQFTGTGTAADPYVVASVQDLQDLSDVLSVGTPTDGQVLTYNADAGLWRPFNVVHDLNDLNDVIINAPADDEVLQFNSGSNLWTAQPPTWVPQNPEVRSQYLTAGATVWDPGSVAIGSQVSTTIDIPGVTLAEEWVFHVATGQLTGLHAWAAVTNTDTVTLYLSNMTSNAVNLGSRTWRVYGWR